MLELKKSRNLILLLSLIVFINIGWPEQKVLIKDSNFKKDENQTDFYDVLSDKYLDKHEGLIPNVPRKNGVSKTYYSYSKRNAKTSAELIGDNIRLRPRQLKDSCFYKEWKIIGEKKSYYNTGQLKNVEYYKNGILNGERKSYYPNGKTQSIRNYKNGKMEGVAKMYYKNGELK